MAFVETLSEAHASGAVAEMYEGERARLGEVPNFVKAFSLRPDVYAAWLQLNGAVKSNMDLRRYELATLAAARRLHSSYCTLAHASVLMRAFFEPDAVRALVEDYHTAGLEPVDVAIMELAEKVAQDATSVTAEDIQRLRDFGLSDRDILDVVLAAAVRCFFSKTLDALGAEPDSHYAGLPGELRDTLVVGRPIAES
ncbi:MAG TPA: peroxidase-related enzyme [Solirubrobacteraceae bacterium]|nr:peroxidase-related enzyme [Solirubrobacteraceae bacterium]